MGRDNCHNHNHNHDHNHNQNHNNNHNHNNTTTTTPHHTTNNNHANHTTRTSQRPHQPESRQPHQPQPQQPHQARQQQPNRYNGNNVPPPSFRSPRMLFCSCIVRIENSTLVARKRILYTRCLQQDVDATRDIIGQSIPAWCFAQGPRRSHRGFQECPVPFHLFSI